MVILKPRPLPSLISESSACSWWRRRGLGGSCVKCELKEIPLLLPFYHLELKYMAASDRHVTQACDRQAGTCRLPLHPGRRCQIGDHLVILQRKMLPGVENLIWGRGENNSIRTKKVKKRTEVLSLSPGKHCGMTSGVIVGSFEGN